MLSKGSRNSTIDISYKNLGATTANANVVGTLLWIYRKDCIHNFRGNYTRYHYILLCYHLYRYISIHNIYIVHVKTHIEMNILTWNEQIFFDAFVRFGMFKRPINVTVLLAACDDCFVNWMCFRNVSSKTSICSTLNQQIWEAFALYLWRTMCVYRCIPI